jgi:capsular polysaccharide transport system permease protein
MNNTVRSATSVTFSVWKALFLREAVSRLATGRAAWLWLLLEPAAHVAILMVLFSTIRQRSVQGTDFALFLALGVLGFNLFKKAATRSMEAVSANAALFAYRQVKPVDAVLVRAALEGVIQLFIGVLLLAGASLFGFEVLPHDPLGVLVAFVLLWIFGAGLGLILSVGTTLVPEIGKVAKLVFMPLYFLSGVMYSPAMLPPAARPWLLLNPLVHGMEALRAAFFPGYHRVSGVDLGYLATFALLSLLFGLALHVRFATRMTAL